MATVKNRTVALMSAIVIGVSLACIAVQTGRTLLLLFALLIILIAMIRAIYSAVRK